jgi:hypothetical protein
MGYTMLDIAKLNGNDAVLGLLQENVKYSPEVNTLPFRTIRGTNYYTGVTTALPTTGFRAANEGQDAGTSTFAKRLIECFIFGGRVEVDVAIAQAYEDGEDAFKAMQSSHVMQSALRALGSQVWYGVTSDAKGFPGLKAASVAAASTSAGDPYTIDATGGSAGTASSCYLVYAPSDNTGISLIGGQNRTFDLSDWFRGYGTDANSKRFPAWLADLSAWVGLQIPHENCVRRIYNLTAEANKGLTDALLSRAMATFPVGYRATHIFCSRRSLGQLQASRTVTLFGSGSARPSQPLVAPLPTEFEGIPIIATDSILNTDTIGT